jgi:hypothetical protein
MVPSRPGIRSGPYSITLTDAAMPHGRSKIIKIPSRILVLLLSLIILQSCDLPSSQVGPTPTLGPDEFSLCQYLGLAAPVSEAGPIQTVPVTPPAQSTALTGKYPDIQFIPVYPGAVSYVPDRYIADVDGNILRLTAATDINTILQFYLDALPKNGWMPTVTALPPTTPKGSGVGGTFIWYDPANTIPWGMKLEVAIIDTPLPNSTADRSELFLLYKRYAAIGKGLAIYPSASNIKTTCSENFTMKFSVEDRSWRATIHKSYVTQASPQEVADWYSKSLPEYAWRLQDDGTYYGTYTIAPNLVEFLSHLEVRISPADGGGTKVELTQSVHRYIEPRLD